MNNLIKKIFRKIRYLYLTKEEKFYENFFIHNPYWNKESPNEDESARWKAIKNLIEAGVEINKPIRILEVGCGRGWMTKLLSHYGQAEGIEPVNGVVRHARKLFPGIIFHEGYAKKLIEMGLDGQYKLIVASEVIEHIPSNMKGVFICDMKALLDSNGYLLLTTPRKELLPKKKDRSNQPVEDWLTEDELRDLLIKNNFEVIRQTRIAPTYIQPSVEIYQAWLFRKS